MVSAAAARHGQALVRRRCAIGGARVFLKTSWPIRADICVLLPATAGGAAPTAARAFNLNGKRIPPEFFRAT
jgi:hypothetical protein